MKISIVIPVLNSHEILRRQLIYMSKFIQEDTEIIIVDDGSDPPLEYNGKLPVKIIRTNDTRPWTWALARNRGVKEASGSYLVMFDIDHIITPELLEMVRTFGGQKLHFKREFGVLTEEAEFTQDIEELKKYGFLESRLAKRGLQMTPLPNNFAMRRDIFWELGGYREDLVEREYPQGEDRLFKKAWCQWKAAGNGTEFIDRPTIYMIPNGYKAGTQHVDFNPFNLFHTLTRATKRNHWHRKKRSRKK
ncbi:MAG TPA: glycosyltransferase family 2 protein [Methanosarcinales archaeon]|nr:glycosyltransferase family 2 protein [Methanosarcinales archaeon]